MFPHKLFVVLALLGAALPPLASADDPVVSQPEQRETVELTVYNQDLALIREVRRVDLPRGAFSLEFQGVPERIRPATLLIEAGGRTGLVVREQNYEFDLMNKGKILEKYVGRDIAWIQEDGERINGRLLGIASGPVYEVAGEVVFEVPGRIALPQLPSNLRARPTLVWSAETAREGEAELDVSYLTGGMSWQSDYVLQLDPQGQKADLKGWVTVENRSGTGFDDATLQLVAGEINQVRPAMVRREMLALSAALRLPPLHRSLDHEPARQQQQAGLDAGRFRPEGATPLHRARRRAVLPRRDAAGSTGRRDQLHVRESRVQPDGHAVARGHGPRLRAVRRRETTAPG